jgi:hypothetical protein
MPCSGEIVIEKDGIRYANDFAGRDIGKGRDLSVISNKPA